MENKGVIYIQFYFKTVKIGLSAFDKAIVSFGLE